VAERVQIRYASNELTLENSREVVNAAAGPNSVQVFAQIAVKTSVRGLS
jgi:hypothetical protein